MPPTAPVPSKSALRALRNIALGTSCTIVFGAGLLTTEDRRQRIQFATKVRDNARNIESVKGYHTNEQLGLLQVRFGPEVTKTSQQNKRSQKQSNGPLLKSRKKREEISRKLLASREQTLCSNLAWSNPIQTDSTSTDLVADNPDERANRLAFEIVRTIGNGSNAAKVKTATWRLRHAFEAHRPILNARLKDAAAQLATACDRHSDYASMQEVLGTILSCGSLTSKEFECFKPEQVVAWLLEHHQDHSEGQQWNSEEDAIKEATLIFLTTLLDRNSTSAHMHAVGHQLCEKTCARKLFLLTEKIYWKLHAIGGVTSKSIKYLITASHGLKKYQRVIRFFERFYHIAGNQDDFVNVVELVLDCTAHIGSVDVASRVYSKAAILARDAGLRIPSSWLLRMLGQQWRDKRDITETRKLFDCLEQHVTYTTVPQAAYAAIIQFCIEANQEHVAEMYFVRFQEMHPTSSLGIRICGHIALVKAKREDWLGVRQSLDKMTTRMQSVKQIKDSGAVFVPIFKLYAQTHSLGETEAFLHASLRQYNMPLTYYMSTFMINLYGQNKELEALIRWVEYVLSISPSLIDAGVFNVMLRNCRRSWHLSFHEMIRLFWAVKKLGCVRALGLTDDATYDTLLSIAIQDARRNPDKLAQIINFRIFNRPRPYLSSTASLQLTMSEAIARRRGALALRLLARAKAQHQFRLTGNILVTAVQASIQVYEYNMGPTIALLKQVKSRHFMGMALGQILLQQLRQRETDGWHLNKSQHDVVLERIQKTIGKLQHEGFSVPRAVLWKMAYIFNRLGAYQQALEFWKVHIEHRPALMTWSRSLDIPFRAYLGLKDPTGLRWICAMIVQYDIRPKVHWYLKLREIIYDTHDEPALQEFHKTACQTIVLVQKQRHMDATERGKATVSTFEVMQDAVSAHRTMRHLAQIPPDKLTITEHESIVLDPLARIRQNLTRTRLPRLTAKGVEA